MPTTSQPGPQAAAINQPGEQQQPLTPAQRFTQDKKSAEALLQRYLPQITQCLPKILTPERMMRVALTAMSRTPDLLQCTQTSLIASVLTCAQLGLLPDSIIGEAYLIPFNNTKRGIKEATVIIGYKGLCTLAMRSGQVKSIQAKPVYKGDTFAYKLGIDDVLDHIPNGNMNAAEITHFYAVVKLMTGGHVIDVMTREAAEAIRNESANYKFSKKKEETVWGKYFAEMGQKTVLRRIMKLVPLSAELNRAVAIDEAADIGLQKNTVEFMDSPSMPEDYAQEVTAEIMEEEGLKKEEDLEQARQDSAAKGQNAMDATLNLLDKKS